LILSHLKERLALGGNGTRLGAAALAEALQIPDEQAVLALRMLVAMLPTKDPILGGDGVGDADLRDLLLFLYIQSYKAFGATHQQGRCLVSIIS
jgi:TBCC domain-containing protein 1